MAHTNETPNYHLPQFVGTDIINPLVDTNGAYSAIDTALKDISDNEVTDAGKILALETTVGDSSAGLVKDVADLQTQNGDSVLTTDAQTLSAAINEVDAHTDTNTGNIADNALAITGLQNTVGNANSGLVKDVADLQNKTFQMVKHSITITADGVKTYSTILSELLTSINAITGRHIYCALELGTIKMAFEHSNDGLAPTSIYSFVFSGFEMTSSAVTFYYASLRDGAIRLYSHDGTTRTDMLNDVPSGGTKIVFSYLNVEGV